MTSDSVFAERALTMIPDDVDLETVDGLLGYLWRTGADLDKGERGAQFNEMLKWQYEGGYYPDFALRYNYNQLEGMPENAIYIGQGDLDLFSKIMMQRAMNLHKDKFIVVSSFLFLQNYRDGICKHLGIPPYEIEASQFQLSKFIHYLSEKTDRPIYLNASVPYNLESSSNTEIKEFCDSLYQEGLLLKYSTTPYDNATAAMRAFEKYHLEYLTEPRFRTEIGRGAKNCKSITPPSCLNSFSGLRRQVMRSVRNSCTASCVPPSRIRSWTRQQSNAIFNTLKTSAHDTPLP